MDYLWIVGKLILIYFLLIIIFRFLGKREVGELSIFDFIIVLIIADIASMGVDNEEFFIPSLLCLVVLVVLQKILSLCMLHVAKLRGVVDGTPTIIVYDGIIKIKNMQKELYTMDDLVSQMHYEHIETISEIRLAILETNGTLSIFRSSKFDKAILPIVISGQISMDNIRLLNINKIDIINTFKSNGLDLKKVMYADYQDGKIIFYYRKNKKIEDLHKDTLVLRKDN